MISFEGALIALRLAEAGRSRLNQTSLKQKRDGAVNRRWMRVAKTSSAKDPREIFNRKVTRVAQRAARDPLAHLRIFEILVADELPEPSKGSFVEVRCGLRASAGHSGTGA